MPLRAVDRCRQKDSTGFLAGERSTVDLWSVNCYRQKVSAGDTTDGQSIVDLRTVDCLTDKMGFRPRVLALDFGLIPMQCNAMQHPRTYLQKQVVNLL